MFNTFNPLVNSRLTYMINSLSMPYSKVATKRMKWILSLLEFSVLFCLSFNIAIAAQISGQIFTTGFESGSLSRGGDGFSWTASTSTQVSTEKPETGSYSLKFRFAGNPADGEDSWAEQRLSLGSGDYPDLWVKFDLYIPSNYFQRTQTIGAENNKAWAIWGGGDDGYHWYLRDGPLLGGHFWPTTIGTYGESDFIPWVASQVNGERTNLDIQHKWGLRTLIIEDNDRSHWMTLIIHAKYATSANNDGVYQVWKINWQGTKKTICNIQDGNWYSTIHDTNLPAPGFDSAYLLGWSNTGFDSDTYLYIDNFEISSTPIDVSSTTNSNNSAAPNPPTIK